jgi:hypothetical protein
MVTPRAQRDERGVGRKRFEYPHGALPTEDAHLRGARRASPFLPRLLKYPLPTSLKLSCRLKSRLARHAALTLAASAIERNLDSPPATCR